MYGCESTGKDEGMVYLQFHIFYEHKKQASLNQMVTDRDLFGPNCVS